MKAVFPVKFRSLFLSIAAIAAQGIGSPAFAQSEDTLVLAVYPYLPSEELIKKFSPLAKYLGKKVGKRIDVKIGRNYEEHIQYIGEDKVDIAYMGPASYIALLESFEPKPILAKLEVDGKTWFQGDIIVRRDSGIATLGDLKGKRIAFGDPNSTMSFIIPHYMLHKAGVFSASSPSHFFVYSHYNVAVGVLSGDFDAGAVNPGIFGVAEGLRMIARTPRISEHLFLVRADSPSELTQALRRAMLSMNKTEEGLAALHSIKRNITNLVEAESSDYENLRKIIEEAQELH